MFASVQEIAVAHCEEVRANACKALISNNNRVSVVLERKVRQAPKAIHALDATFKVSLGNERKKGGN